MPRRDGWYEGVEGGEVKGIGPRGWCVLGLEGLLGDGDLSLLRAHSLLADIFGKYGAIRQVRLGCEKDTRGRAYVVFEDIHDAKNACDHLSGYSVGNRYLIVSYHQPSKQLKVTFFVCGGERGVWCACACLVLPGGGGASCLICWLVCEFWADDFPFFASGAGGATQGGRGGRPAAHGRRGAAARWLRCWRAAAGFVASEV